MAPNDPSIEALYNFLAGMEAAMKSHYNVFTASLEIQRSTVERMQILVHRHTILLKGGPLSRTFPKESCHSAEDDIKSDFYEKRRLLDESNSKLESSLGDIREKYSALQDLMKDYDESWFPALQRCDNARPPVAYFVEVFSDFLKFFTRLQSKLNCFASLLTPSNIQPLNTYKKLLSPDADFKDNYGKSLAYCRCLHNKPKT